MLITIWCSKEKTFEKKRNTGKSNQKSGGKSLSNETVKNVHFFYKSDEMSHITSGNTDCVTVKVENGDKYVMSK